MRQSFIQQMLGEMLWKAGSTRSGGMVGVPPVMPLRGLSKRISGRARTHAGHVRRIKKAQRRRTYYHSLKG